MCTSKQKRNELEHWTSDNLGLGERSLPSAIWAAPVGVFKILCYKKESRWTIKGLDLCSFLAVYPFPGTWQSQLPSNRLIMSFLGVPWATERHQRGVLGSCATHGHGPEGMLVAWASLGMPTTWTRGFWMPSGGRVSGKSVLVCLSQTPWLPLWWMESSWFAFCLFSSRKVTGTARSSRSPMGKCGLSQPLSPALGPAPLISSAQLLSDLK